MLSFRPSTGRAWTMRWLGDLRLPCGGAPRATKDIDLLVLPRALDHARAAVRACGYSLEALPMEFKDGTTVRRMNRVDHDGSLMTVDLMLAEGSLQSAWSNRVRLPFTEIHAQV